MLGIVNCIDQCIAVSCMVSFGIIMQRNATTWPWWFLNLTFTAAYGPPLKPSVRVYCVLLLTPPPGPEIELFLLKLIDLLGQYSSGHKSFSILTSICTRISHCNML